MSRFFLAPGRTVYGRRDRLTIQARFDLRGMVPSPRPKRDQGDLQTFRLRSEGKEELVRAEGVEPSRTFRLYGFSYRLRLSPPWRGARQRRRRVCGLDYPFTVSQRVPGLRCYPSSLYTFPGGVFRRGLVRDCHCRVPRIWAVLHRRFPGKHSSFVSSPLRLPFRHARVTG